MPFSFSGDLTHTWKYEKIMGEQPVECAHIWAGGNSLDKACPYSLENEWKNNKNKIQAIFKSFKIAGLDVSKLNVLDIIPEKFLKKFLQNKNQISEHIFNTNKKPENYDFMLELFRLVEDIKQRPLNINFDFLKKKLGNTYFHNLYKRIYNRENLVSYNPYGTVTGRLTTTSGSFPILTLSKEARDIILPNNDVFIELDFNAAELRTMLALSEIEQPLGDIHEWNNKEIFGGKLDRDEVKKRTFSWLYDQKKLNKSFEKLYNRDTLLKKYWSENEEIIRTPFHRKIKSDHKHALNYLIQSTSSDNFLKQVIKVQKLLKGKKTNVAFAIHDSLVLDFSLSDKALVKGLVEEFSNTELGNFKVNISGGKSFGKMKEMNI